MKKRKQSTLTKKQMDEAFDQYRADIKIVNKAVDWFIKKYGLEKQYKRAKDASYNKVVARLHGVLDDIK